MSTNSPSNPSTQTLDKLEQLLDALKNSQKNISIGSQVATGYAMGTNVNGMIPLPPNTSFAAPVTNGYNGIVVDTNGYIKMSPTAPAPAVTSDAVTSLMNWFNTHQHTNTASGPLYPPVSTTTGYITTTQTVYNPNYTPPAAAPSFSGYLSWPTATSGWDLGLEPGENADDVLAEFKEWRKQKKLKAEEAPATYEFERYVEL